MADDRPRRGRGRRPAAEVRKEILEAAAELLFDDGMAGFTIEKVANVSGASKMTIYKWWPSKGALALDGYFHRVDPELVFPDTGDIEADLRTQLHSFLRVSDAQRPWRPLRQRRHAASCARTSTQRPSLTNCGGPAITGCCYRISR